MDDIRASYPAVELHSHKRFYTLRTEKKEFNIVISRSYTGFIGDIASGLGVKINTSEEEISAPSSAPATA
ncbi:MAG: hypothetical protein IKZ97_04550 [Butyrivibrio sp.]|nr:hypothetical protein [Butyrivibrio sp.]